MTRRAGGEGTIPGHLSSGEVVAFFARDLRMPAPQRVAGTIVIERRAVDRLERRRHVATAARRAELAAMRVRVTCGALLVLERSVARNRRTVRVGRELQARTSVAGVALRGRMRSREGIVGRVVVEARRGLPVLHAVALEAVLVERATMCVFVAGGAARLESDPPDVAATALRQTRRLGHAIAGLVAVGAFLACVTALERPTRTRMFKALDGSPLAFPAHHCEIDAGVLRMAARAALRFDGGGAV